MHVLSSTGERVSVSDEAKARQLVESNCSLVLDYLPEKQISKKSTPSVDLISLNEFSSPLRQRRKKWR